MLDTKVKHPIRAAVHHGRMASMQDRIQEIVKDWADGNQSKLAKECGLTRSSVNQWYNGRTEPTPANVFAIADKTHYAARWIATGQPPKKEPKRNDQEMRRLWERYNSLPVHIRRAIDSLLERPGAEKASGDAE